MSKYYYDEKAAEEVVFFIENLCTHVKGEYAGQSIVLEDWQKKDLINPIFGWKRKDGTRKYRTVYIEIPRKNAKSTICAAIELYLLAADGEKGAEIYCAAAAREQVASVFDPCKHMVLQNEHLKSKLTPYRNSIVVNNSASFLKAISADSDTKHGFNANGIVIDELHAQPNRDLYDVLTTSTGSRRQPLTFMITTAGFDKNSICWELHEYARKVNQGIIKDDSFYGIIYAADEDDDIYEEETWKKANPGYGTIVKKDYIAEQATKAKNEPSFENTFKRLHLNIWTASHTKWIPDAEWMKCDKGGAVSDLKGRVCYGGLDLASTRDITALVLIFPEKIDGEVYFDVLCRFWCSEETAEQRGNKGGVNYMTWADKGHMTLTPGNVTDYNFIKSEFDQIVKDYDIKVLGYDPYNASQLIIDLSEKFGRTNLQFNKSSQSVQAMNEPTKALEKAIGKGVINHYGNPVLRWMLDNVMIHLDANDNIHLNKKKATGKIDGIVAMAIAFGEYMTPGNEEPEIVTDFFVG